MTEVSADWIREQIAGRRGVQAALAKAIGLTSTQMTLIMKGDRKISAAEAAKIQEFFGFDVSVGKPLTEAQKRLLEATLMLEDSEIETLIHFAFSQAATKNNSK